MTSAHLAFAPSICILRAGEAMSVIRVIRQCTIQRATQRKMTVPG